MALDNHPLLLLADTPVQTARSPIYVPTTLEYVKEHMQAADAQDQRAFPPGIDFVLAAPDFNEALSLPYFPNAADALENSRSKTGRPLVVAAHLPTYYGDSSRGIIVDSDRLGMTQVLVPPIDLDEYEDLVGASHSYTPRDFYHQYEIGTQQASLPVRLWAAFLARALPFAVGNGS